MPTHSFTEEDPECGQYEVELDFKITHSGSSPSWDDPGSPPEIDILSASVHGRWGRFEWDASYDNPIPDAEYERWEQHVLENFDFNDWYADQEADWHDSERNS